MLNPELPRPKVALDPPEGRGLARDQVRLLISNRADGQIHHGAFRSLPDYLSRGDLVVVNESRTLASSLEATLDDGTPVRLHLSTQLSGNLWVVEVRRIVGGGTLRISTKLRSRQRLQLTGGGQAVLLSPSRSRPTGLHETREGVWRLWEARLELPCGVFDYLATYGAPIRYRQGGTRWPLPYFQTIFSRVSGSAEMPSASRAFSPEIVTALDHKGVRIAKLVLHTGVSSLEAGEPPFAEWYQLPEATARAVNSTRARGNRVLAVGTTVVRALETAYDHTGTTQPGAGWTHLHLSPLRKLYGELSVLTGLHEPSSSHWEMLFALMSGDLLWRSFYAGIDGGYLWHEFGDMHLIL